METPIFLGATRAVELQAGWIPPNRELQSCMPQKKAHQRLAESDSHRRRGKEVDIPPKRRPGCSWLATKPMPSATIMDILHAAAESHGRWFEEPYQIWRAPSPGPWPQFPSDWKLPS
jgi:hypothetical protein